MLKLSGEAFGGGRVGVDPDVVHNIAGQVAKVVQSGVQVAIVRRRQLLPRGRAATARDGA